MIYRSKEDLVLASGSPRRRDLLGSAGLTFRVIVPGCDESSPEGESPQEMVRRLSLLKAAEVAKDNISSWVIGADTTVMFDGKALGKPSGVEEARQMLNLIKGTTHHVLGGFAIINRKKGIEHVEVHSSAVSIGPLSSDQITSYINTGEPLDKAGAYAVQGAGATFVSSVNGSYTNVVGLPLMAVIDLLLKFGAIQLAG